jgi:hypothetical protein
MGPKRQRGYEDVMVLLADQLPTTDEVVKPLHNPAAVETGFCGDAGVRACKLARTSYGQHWLRSACSRAQNQAEQHDPSPGIGDTAPV